MDNDKSTPYQTKRENGLHKYTHYLMLCVFGSRKSFQFVGLQPQILLEHTHPKV